MKKLLLVLVVLTIATLPTRSFAAEKSWSVLRWDAVIAVQADSTFLVEEAVTYNFQGNFHFVNRYILKNRFDSISDFTVLTADREPLTNIGEAYGFSEASDRYNISLSFDASDETKTYIFRYLVHGGVGYFDDHDEVFWNVLPVDMEVGVGSASVTVSVPEGATQSQLAARVDGDGHDQTARVVDDQTMLFTGHSFPAQSNFTIVAGWPRGLVFNPGVYRFASAPNGAQVRDKNTNITYGTTPTAVRVGSELEADRNYTFAVEKFGYQPQEFHFTAQNDQTTTFDEPLQVTWWYAIGRFFFYVLLVLYALHPLGLLVWLILKWRHSGRDPKGRGTIVAQYEAPDHLRPTLLGVLIDEKVDLHEISAALVDLAERGYIHIKELPKKWGSDDYEFTKKKEFVNDASLHPYERELLTALFGTHASRKLSDIKNKFYTHIPTIKEKLYNQITQLGYFESNPDKKRRTYRNIGLVLLVLGFVGSGLLIGFPLFISAVILLIFSQLMPKRTPKGVFATEHALGFKDYLYTAERYRVQKLTPELFEKFLPYAMVFKIEKEWAAKFKDIYKGSPEWYEGVNTHGFTSILLASHLSSLNTSAAQTFASTPGGSSASGSSGFSGGGFSGGGGGGGGMSAG